MILDHRLMILVYQGLARIFWRIDLGCVVWRGNVERTSALSRSYEAEASWSIERISGDPYTWFCRRRFRPIYGDRNRHQDGTQFFLHSESDWS